MIRKIIHIDMDAFYASVEQRDDPSLLGKPVVVGGSPESRGVVAAASYEARKYGIRSAMSSAKAFRLCPKAVFVRPRFSRYKEVSASIHEIFHSYTDLVEPLSLDEAYLDVTENKVGELYAVKIASEIRKRIWNELQLTASAGIATSKFVAKLASEVNKPNGWKAVLPYETLDFLATMPIEKFHGIGKVTLQKMNSLGIYNGLDLRNTSREILLKHFGKVGEFFYSIGQGIDPRSVNPEREPKSVGAENTFSSDLLELESILAELRSLSKQVHLRIEAKSVRPKTITLKFKYSDFTLQTRSKTYSETFVGEEEIFEKAKFILTEVWPLSKSIRLLGVSVSNFGSGVSDQPELFDRVM